MSEPKFAFLSRSELADLIFGVTEGGRLTERTPGLGLSQRQMILALKELVLYRIQFADMEEILAERAQMAARDLNDILTKKPRGRPQ